MTFMKVHFVPMKTCMISTVIPFGLSNASTTFQAMMNDLSHSYMWKFVLVFFDSILVYKINWNFHLKHIETVLKLLE
jgi:hypothetical protein